MSLSRDFFQILVMEKSYIICRYETTCFIMILKNNTYFSLTKYSSSIGFDPKCESLVSRHCTKVNTFVTNTILIKGFNLIK